MAQSIVKAASWEQQSLTLSVQHQSLADIAGMLADKLGKSILIEGAPARLSLDVDKTDTAEAVINQVAEAFDYSWRVSQSGVLLFQKRFRNRNEYPQFVVPELNESITDIFATMRSLRSYADLSVSIQEQMISIAKSLSPQQIEFLKQGGKIRIGTMPEEQRANVEKAIYTHMFRNIGRDFKALEEQLAGLKTSVLQNDTSVLANPLLHQQETQVGLRLWYGASAQHRVSLYKHTLTQEDASPTETDAVENAPNAADANIASRKQQAPGANKADPFNGATTLEKVVQALAQQTETPLRVAPALASRRLIVQFRKITRRQAMEALAELEGWDWRTMPGGVSTLSRPRLPVIHNLEEIRQAVARALPADLHRFLMNKPDLGEDEVTFKLKFLSYMSHENANRVRVKLEGLVTQEGKILYNTLQTAFPKVDKVAYNRLSTIQRTQIESILILKACASSVVNLMSFFDTPTTYESNPAEAFLYFHPSGTSPNLVEILIAGDLTPTQRGGAFGTRLLLDSMSAPPFPVQ